jgi:pSer/pThr/pTyr-binding forkhead associated (FHA) protein
VAGRASLVLPDGSEHPLARPVFTIGRTEENDLRLSADTVSRMHALVIESAGRWFIEDRGSFNGTYLNGNRIQPGVRLPLRHGDRVTVGSESIVFASPAELSDPDRTEPLADAVQPLTRPLSPFQTQVVRCLCEPWLAGGSLDDLPSNEEIARRIGTPGATETVKAALRRAYAKAGLATGPPYAKRRALCKLARQRGWV